MKWFFLAVTLGLVGCTGHDIDVSGTEVTVIVEECVDTAEEPLRGDDDPYAVITTCDDHKPCTVDVQCTPCSALPEKLRRGATCVYDDKLSPFCFDLSTGALLYTGCTHFIQDPTPPGTINACFPVAFPDDPSSEVHPGVCDAFGICVENP